MRLGFVLEVCETRELIARSRERRELMTLPDNEDPFHRFLRNAECKLLSCPRNPSVYPVRAQPELSPHCILDLVQWPFGGLGVDPMAQIPSQI